MRYILDKIYEENWDCFDNLHVNSITVCKNMNEKYDYFNAMYSTSCGLEFQTGCSFYNNNVNAPVNRMELYESEKEVDKFIYNSLVSEIEEDSHLDYIIEESETELTKAQIVERFYEIRRIEKKANLELSEFMLNVEIINNKECEE